MATIPVHAGGNLQAAMNAAVAGDILELDNAATFVGNFVWPVHSGGSDITLQGVTVPPPGVRVSPGGSAGFPKLRASAGGSPALSTAVAAHDWRANGIEFLPNPGGFNDIISLGDGSSAQNDLSQVPFNLTLDRCYIHGDATIGQKRGISLQSGQTSIVNCYINDIKAVGQDTQAIAAWNGPGPYLIDNNYLEASGENFLTGGATTYIPLNIPSDITFTNNAVAKPLAWRGVWSVKNLLELKSAQRVLIDSNTFDYDWADGQVGIPILFTVRNQDYDPTHPTDPSNNYWNTIVQVQFTRNIVRHAGGAISILGREDRIISGIPVPSGLLTNLLIQDNLFYDITQAYGGSARFLQINAGDAITVDHNTCLNTQPGPSDVSIYLIDRITTNLVIKNNIGVNNGLFVFGTNGKAPGAATLADQAPGSIFTNNAIIAGTPVGYPAGNFYPADIAAILFVDPGANNYQLQSGSPYHNAATDGTDIGARVGTPPPVFPSPATTPSPAAGAVNVSLTPTLSWVAGAHTLTFDVLLGTVNPPVTVVSSAQAGTSYVPSARAASTTYYWRVRSNNGDGTTVGPVWSFLTSDPTPVPPVFPDPPTTPTPTAGAVSVSVTPVLSWVAGAHSSTFDVLLDTANPPTTVVSSGQAGVTYSPAPLDTGETYFWRVRAHNADGQTVGPVWSFSTINTAPPPLPGIPTDPVPASGAANVSVRQRLSWTEGADTDTSDVLLDVVTPPVMVVSRARAGVSYTPSTPLSHFKRYYWRVRANNANGITVGDIWSFVTIADHPLEGGPVPTTSSRTTTISYDGDVTATIQKEDAPNENSPGALDLIDLVTGNNVVTVPTGGAVAVAVTIIPPVNNVFAISLKGGVGVSEVGVAINKTNPMTLSLDPTVTIFVLRAEAAISGVQLIWT